MERERIKAALGKFSYGELARRVGYGKSHISLVFRGQRTPSLELVIALAKELHCSTDDLAKFLEKPVEHRPDGPRPKSEEARVAA